MKALTLMQPWATLIINGPKRIENRTWRPPHDLIGQVIAIHAGKRYDKARWLEVRPLADDGHRPETPFLGAILGTARISGVLVASSNPWFTGPFGWQLEDIMTLDLPVLCKGAQGLWRVPAKVLQRVAECSRISRERHER